jgi:uncharacterized protein YjbI with pentapeptide repeats
MPRRDNLARLRSVNPQSSAAEERRFPGRGLWGFRNRTVWDYLQLFLLPTVVLLGVGGLLIQASRRQERSFAEQRQLVETQYQQTLLQRYFDNIATALTQDLRTSAPESELRTVTKTRTLATLRELNGDRKGLLLQFLHDSQLIRTPNATINLGRADLRNAVLDNATLNTAMLNGADFSDASLQFANLGNSNLNGALFQNADLESAFMGNTVAWGGYFRHANLSQANLSGADLRFAILSYASLEGARLNNTILSGAILEHANLRAANLQNTSLEGVFLCNTTMPDGSVENRDCPK